MKFIPFRRADPASSGSETLKKSLMQSILIFLLAALLQFLVVSESRAQSLSPEAFLKPASTESEVRVATGETLFRLLTEKFRLGFKAHAPEACHLLKAAMAQNEGSSTRLSIGSYYETVQKCAQPLIAADGKALIAKGQYGGRYLEGLPTPESFMAKQWGQLSDQDKIKILTNVALRIIAPGRMNIEGYGKFTSDRFQTLQHPAFAERAVTEVIDTMVLMTVLSQPFLAEDQAPFHFEPGV